MFKNMLVSGVKQLVETQLNKPSNQGNQPQQPNQSNMNYGSGYGNNQGSGYPPQNQGGNYGAPAYPPTSGGYPQSGPTELNYSAPASGSGYPPQNSYPGQGGGSYPGAQPYPPQNDSNTPYPSSSPYPGGQSNPGQIGFNVGAAAPAYPPSGPPYGGTAYPSAPSGYPQAAPAYPTQGYPQASSGYQAPSSQPSYPSQGYQQQYAPSGGYQPPAQFGSGFGTGPAGGYGQQQAMWGNPSVKNYPAFNPNADAESLRKAKGFGCDNTKKLNQTVLTSLNGCSHSCSSQWPENASFPTARAAVHPSELALKIRMAK